MPRSLQVGADGRIRPSLRVKIDNGAAALVGIGDLGVGGISSGSHGWLGSISQDALNGVVRRPTIKVQKTDGCNLMRAKARVFCFQIDDQLAHLWRKIAACLSRGSALFGKQACQAILLKLVRLVAQGAFAHTRFFRTRSCRLSKQHEGAQPLIDLLLWPERLLLNFLPLVGGFS